MKPDESRTVYDGKLFDVTLERWGEHEREIVEHPGAVAIVAVDDDGTVTLVRQLREAARKHLLELPAGTLEVGEEPLDSARRELEEETGLTGGEWRELAAFYTTPGFCRELMHLFAAEGVQQGAASPEDDEELELVRLPVSEIGDHLAEIEDAKTLAGLLLYPARAGPLARHGRFGLDRRAPPPKGGGDRPADPRGRRYRATHCTSATQPRRRRADLSTR
jgi:ADP-ribose pyrophosphatase